MTRTLLALQLRVLWAERGDSFVFWLASAVGGVVLIVTLWLAPRAFAPIVARDPAAAEALVLIAFAAVGLFQLLAAVRWAVDRLYLASDIELLLSAPVPLRSLYLAKVTEVVGRSPVSMAVAVVAGYGIARAARAPAAVVLAVIAPVLLAGSAAAFGIALTTVVARIVPPARIKAVLMVLPALVGIGFGIGGQLIGSTQRSDVGGREPGRVLEALTAVGDTLRWLPTSWPGSMVTSAAAADAVRWLIAVGLTLVGLVAMVALGFVSFRSSFHVTWGRVGEAAVRRRRSVLDRLALPLAPAARAIVIKDWRLTARDLKRAMGILFPVLFIGFLAVRSIIEAPREGAGGAVFNMAILLLVLGGSSVQTFVYEGESIWVLRSAPVDARTFFVAKLAAQALPTAAIVTVLSLVIAVLGGVPAAGIAVGIPFAVAVVTGLGAIGLSFTLLLGDPGASEPGSNLALTIVTIFGGGAFAGANMAMAAWIVGTVGGGSSPLLHPAIGVLSFVAATTAWAAGAVIAGRAIGRLERLGFR